MNMGLGMIGGSTLTWKTNFRWTFQVNNLCGGRSVPEFFLKSAARPQWTTEDVQIDFLNARTWIPGKTSFETITVTYYDVAAIENRALWDWLASVNNFTDPVRLQQASKISDYAGTGVIVMYDGCGTPLEQWTLGTLWPTSVNFGELAYDNSEPATIELTMRYSNVLYQSLCPGFTPQNCCTPCSGGASGELAL